MNPTRLKTGDILHCTGKRWISRMIRKFTKSKFSHTALFIEIWGQPYIIDAQKDGVNVRPWQAWLDEFDYEVLVHRSSDPIDPKEFAKRALTKVGNTAYDFEGLLLRHPWQLLTGKWDAQKDPYDNMTCSEYVMWVFAVEKAYTISPENVYRWCKLNHFHEIVI